MQNVRHFFGCIVMLVAIAAKAVAIGLFNFACWVADDPERL